MKKLMYLLVILAGALMTNFASAQNPWKYTDNNDGDSTQVGKIDLKLNATMGPDGIWIFQADKLAQNRGTKKFEEIGRTLYFLSTAVDPFYKYSMRVTKSDSLYTELAEGDTVNRPEHIVAFDAGDIVLVKGTFLNENIVKNNFIKNYEFGLRKEEIARDNADINAAERALKDSIAAKAKRGNISDLVDALDEAKDKKALHDSGKKHSKEYSEALKSYTDAMMAMVNPTDGIKKYCYVARYAPVERVNKRFTYESKQGGRVNLVAFPTD